MSYEVKDTSRSYSNEAGKHMSVKGGSFGTDRRGSLKPPLTPDRTGTRQRGKSLSPNSPVTLAGRPRQIV